jgi:hypothetical protein
VGLAGCLDSCVRAGTPSALFGLEAPEIADSIGVSLEAGGRVAELLSRGGQFAIEHERLGARGIWIITRAEDYQPTLDEAAG